jgi:hypothetical protein
MRQCELAARTGLSRFYINHVLKGRRNASRLTVEKLVKAVPGTKVMDWLFTSQNKSKLNRLVDQATP